jgi:hypothetical protein
MRRPAEQIVLEPLCEQFTVCQLTDFNNADLTRPFTFAAVTDEEYSLVCRTADVPDNTIAREDGWRGFRIAGTLDFSLTGILAGIADILAEHAVGLFAVSTFNTDYIFVKDADFQSALELLGQAGYPVNDGH